MPMYYLITIRSTAQTMGIYQGASPDEAIQAMSRDAGYASLEAEAQAIATTADELRADLSVGPVPVEDLIWRIVSAMLQLDRDSGDCSAETLADPDAGDASDWDVRSMADIAEDVADSIGRIVAEQYRELILDTYRVAWREAVEAEAADEVALHDIACDIAEAMMEQGLPATELPDYTMTSDDARYVRAALAGSASRSELAAVEAAVRAYQVAR